MLGPCLAGQGTKGESLAALGSVICDHSIRGTVNPLLCLLSDPFSNSPRVVPSDSAILRRMVIFGSSDCPDKILCTVGCGTFERRAISV